MSKTKQELVMAARTSIGRVRDHNEDNFIVTDNNSEQWLLPRGVYTNSERGTIMAIADGMGGLNSGEVASKIAIDSIKAFLDSAVLEEVNGEHTLAEAIMSAHQNILTHSKENPEAAGMGTTAVVAKIADSTLEIAWVGDSRCYLFRNRRLYQLSTDHSYVQGLLEEGKISKEQAFYHPNANVITQSLGDESNPPKPDYLSKKLYQDDIVLLCSDGLNSMIEDSGIEKIIRENDQDIPKCVEKLIAAANEAGGNDNITVILNKVVTGEKCPFEDTDGRFLTSLGSTISSLATIGSASENDKPPIRKKANIWLFIVAFLILIISAIVWGKYSKKTSPETPIDRAENSQTPVNGTPEGDTPSENTKPNDQQKAAVTGNGNKNKENSNTDSSGNSGKIAPTDEHNAGKQVIGDDNELTPLNSDREKKESKGGTGDEEVEPDHPNKKEESGNSKTGEVKEKPENQQS